MGWREVSSLLVTAVLAAGSSCALHEVKLRLVGTWTLVRSEYRLKDGTVRPYEVLGPRGEGMLLYSEDGYMCAALMNPDRPGWQAPPTDRERLLTYEGYGSYCGRYEVDVGRGVLVHHPRLSLDPRWVGTTQLRPYRFEADLLILGDVVEDDPKGESWQIVWRKVDPERVTPRGDGRSAPPPAPVPRTPPR